MGIDSQFSQQQRVRKHSWRRRINRAHLKKGIQIIPHLFTLGNGFFGFASIVFSSQGELVAAAYCILLGALMDALDGRIARFANVTSDLGVQLDSLNDAITFCAAPAFLAYEWQLKLLGGFGLGAAAFFMLAGLLRLARFNITHTAQTINFIGMPTPIAGCFIVSLVLNFLDLHFSLDLLSLLAGIITALGFLMISTIPFPTLKHISGKTYRRLFITGTALVITMGHIKLLLILFITYFFYSIFAWIKQHFLQKTIPQNHE